ncbi:uncharacterized protein LOC125031267 [Penaeus chinensis]|uniref:uncharacterized protein LOC125031267 n=1 Tax=Penaeus chinensis TaxID=139456 RepID=UPI001FB6D9DA|nr:uncharacterized protein LOC125031267 [Penaeus chinensis]
MGGLCDWTMFLLLSVLCGMTAGLQITGIQVPPTVISGDQVRLTCSFEFNGDKLYSLTWWKDEQLFFKYLPINNMKTVYETPGITVDKRISTLHEVILSHVDHRASGKMRCEVVADQPSFEKDSMAANITVVDPPPRGPDISGARDSYTIGELLLLNCSSSFSYPPTNLSWVINGQKALRETVVVYPRDRDSEGRESSWSGLQMCLRREHFRNGVLVLRCIATILHVYNISSEIRITDSSYIQSAPREGASTAGAGSSSLLLPLLLLLPGMLRGT